VGKEELYAVLWWGNLRERDNLEDQGVNGRIIMRWIFRQLEFVVWTGQVWLRWRALLNAVMNFRFHKMWGIS
jgi:hypothetical protein